MYTSCSWRHIATCLQNVQRKTSLYLRSLEVTYNFLCTLIFVNQKVKKAAKTAPAAKKASLPTKKAPAAKKPVAATSSIPIKEASGSLPKEAGTNGKVSSIVVEACKQF